MVEPTSSSLRQRAGLTVRYSLATVAFGFAAFCVFGNTAVRSWEVNVTGMLVETVFRIKTLHPPARPDVLFFQSGTGPWAGIQVTAACTIAVFLAPIALTVGVLLCTRRIGTFRVVVAGTAAAATMILVNLGRLVGIVAAFVHGGASAFEWAHVLGGSVATIVGAVIGIWMFVRTIFGSLST